MASSIAIAPPAKAAAYSADCPTLIAQAEARRNIPRGLLMAIAVTESALNGRPNPYAMNIAGRAYHASGTQEMANIIQSNWSRGVRSIDVGCMQINLKFHGQKFARLTDLLDSPTNVEYGASYLISLAADEGSWKQAVMSYHNKNNPARRQWYGCKVWNNYLRLAGAQSGFIACGRTPTGSSTASVGSTKPIVIEGYNAGRRYAEAGPLAPPSQTIRRNMAEIGGTPVDIPIPTKRVEGSLTIVGQSANMPDVVNDDERASAFNAVRPVDWSGRVSRMQPTQASSSAVATASPDQSGFGRVSSQAD